MIFQNIKQQLQNLKILLHNMKTKQEQILSALNKLIRENRTSLMIDKVERVELGSIDELENMFESLQKETKDTLKFLEKALEAKSKFKKEITKRRNTLVAFETKVNQKIGKIEKEAKALGVNKNDILQIKQAEKSIAETGTLIKALNNY